LFYSFNKNEILNIPFCCEKRKVRKVKKRKEEKRIEEKRRNCLKFGSVGMNIKTKISSHSEATSPTRTLHDDFERELRKNFTSLILTFSQLEDKFMNISYLTSRHGPEGRGGLCGYLDMVALIKAQMYALEGV
jgi:hypothetical protein